jgi:dTDP-4-dehydrorhamnose reductase
MRTLITGAKSGLGKYLSEQIKSDTLNRSDELPDIGEEYDLIIHCANNGNHYTWGDANYNFYKDNIFFTRDVVRIPHKKFIHISTYDIEENTPYSAAKRISETIVSTISNNYLIIRPSSLLELYHSRRCFKSYRSRVSI